MISRRLLPILMIVLGLSSCIKSPLIDRTFYNYFPYEVGKSWTYILNDSDTVVISIVGDTLIGTDTVLIFERYDGSRTYIFSTSSAYYTIENTTVPGPQGEVRLEDQIFLLQMDKPFVKGNSWQDQYTNRSIIADDTFRLEHIRIGQVMGVTRINTPAGEFDNVYFVRLMERKIIKTPDGDSVTFSVTNLYFAPDVGPVKELSTINIHDSTENSVSDTTYSIKLELLR